MLGITEAKRRRIIKEERGRINRTGSGRTGIAGCLNRARRVDRVTGPGMIACPGPLTGRIYEDGAKRGKELHKEDNLEKVGKLGIMTEWLSYVCPPNLASSVTN
jgi:hypothetical protein